MHERNAMTTTTTTTTTTTAKIEDERKRLTRRERSVRVDRRAER
jgi:hypothetical protein